jgi:hypothetical protein
MSLVVLVFVPEKSGIKNQLACFIFSTMYFTARCGKISRYLFKMSGINRIYLYKNANNLDQFKRVQNMSKQSP